MRQLFILLMVGLLILTSVHALTDKQEQLLGRLMDQAKEDPDKAEKIKSIIEGNDIDVKEHPGLKEKYDLITGGFDATFVAVGLIAIGIVFLVVLFGAYKRKYVPSEKEFKSMEKKHELHTLSEADYGKVVEFVKEATARGHSKEKIIQALVSRGCEKQQITRLVENVHLEKDMDR